MAGGLWKSAICCSLCFVVILRMLSFTLNRHDRISTIQTDETHLNEKVISSDPTPPSKLPGIIERETSKNTNMSVEKFTGVYGLHKSENFDNYMKALGVGMVLRNLGNTAKPTLTVTAEGNKLNFHSKTTLKTSVIEFTIGEESQSSTMDGRKIKSTVVWDGEKLNEEQVSIDGKGKPTKIVREINAEGDLVITCTVDDVVGVRVYRKK